VGPGGVQVRHDLRLLGGPERLELGQGAAKPDLTCRSIHKVNRNKPPWAISVLRVDYEMSDLPGDRVDDYAAHMTAGSIAATGVAPILNGIFCTTATFLTERNGRAFKSWGNAELANGPGLYLYPQWRP
jgi:hypothetical protein